MQPRTGCIVIPGSVGRDTFQSTPLRQLSHALVAYGIAMGQVLLQCQEYRSDAEPAGVLPCSPLGPTPASGGNVRGQEAVGVPQQRDKTLGVRLQEAYVQDRRGPSAHHVRQRYQSAQVGIAGPILRDEGHRAGPIALPDRQVGAQYGLYAGSTTLLHEIQHAAQVADIGQSQGGIAVICGPVHQLDRRRGAGAEGIPGVGTQLHKAGGQVSRPADTTCR